MTISLWFLMAMENLGLSAHSLQLVVLQLANPEIVALELTPDDLFFVIASDEVFEFISSQVVVDMVRFWRCSLYRCGLLLNVKQMFDEMLLWEVNVVDGMEMYKELFDDVGVRKMVNLTSSVISLGNPICICNLLPSATNRALDNKIHSKNESQGGDWQGEASTMEIGKHQIRVNVIAHGLHIDDEFPVSVG
ncbi:hypothetical protein L6452_20468 [Arctium lappa]|uniref:Uncharacterized protein n=1 Tax=Arctium lappa TaxID=4217 RepID=A0ACB9BCQ2_ARCLA|nr:hypothetical protein L6452_20468 [Arctium lappa]